ncbi:MAG: Ig-like domain-containing protein [Eubacterium sp.]|nr:Ig-like domain-containing protein [Eubacterium sp.]
MKKIKRITTLLLVASIIIMLFPEASFNRGNGVEAATAAEIVNDAAQWVGVTPYVWGGTDLNKGCDCSGFVCAIFKRHGVDFIGTYGIRDAEQIYYGGKSGKIGKIVGNTPDKMRDGYIIIFNSSLGFAGHAGICTHDSNGNKEVIHARGKLYGVTKDAISYLCGGPNGMEILAIIKPNIINGVPSGQNNPSPNKDPDNGSTDNPDSGTDSADNPGHPFSIPSAAVNKNYGNEVRWLQTALNKVMGSNLVVDGSFGPLTEAALKQFQTKYNLKVTGKATKGIVKKLVSIYKKTKGVTALEINKKNMNSLQAGKTVKLTATVTPTECKSVALTWTSSNNSIATVDNTGKVTAVSVGKVEITVSAPNGVKATKSLNIKANPATVKKSEWYNGEYYDAKGQKTNKAVCSWKQDSKGRWYGNAKGWYAKKRWYKIDGYKYRFGKDGYVLDDGWAKVGGYWYYFKSDGKLASNEWVDGYFLSKNGRWTYQYKASWKKTDAGWMYKDTNGWYAKGKTITIDGKDYKFNKKGIWVEQ